MLKDDTMLCENIVDGVKVLLKQNHYKNSLLRKLAVSQTDDVSRDCADSRTCNNV